MADQPNRCPLCGGEPKLFRLACAECEEPMRNWPRVRELVAIRDAAVAFYDAVMAGPMGFASEKRLFELVRQEAEKGAKDARPT